MPARLGLCRKTRRLSATLIGHPYVLDAERELDRILHLLRRKIRGRGFTQLEVQETLGWGRSYISQLLKKQKSLRVDHVLDILRILDVEPAVFFAELYALPSRLPAQQRRTISAGSPRKEDLMRISRLFRSLTGLLLEKGLITRDELSKAIEAQKSNPIDPIGRL